MQPRAANTGRAAIRIFGRSPADTARSQRRLCGVHPAGQPGVEPARAAAVRRRRRSTGRAGPRTGRRCRGTSGRRRVPRAWRWATGARTAGAPDVPTRALVGRHGGAGVGWGTAEDRHEAGQAVVPVGGAGDAVDRGGVVGVGPQQPLLVGPEPAGGHADVATGDGEVGVAGDRHERGRDGLLGRATRSGISDHRHRGALEPGEAVDDPVDGGAGASSARAHSSMRRSHSRRASSVGSPSRRASTAFRAANGGRRRRPVNVRPLGGRPHPATAGATRDDGRSGPGGSADAAACSSRGEGQFRMAGIVAGRPALVQGEYASIT